MANTTSQLLSETHSTLLRNFGDHSDCSYVLIAIGVPVQNEGHGKIGKGREGRSDILVFRVLPS